MDNLLIVSREKEIQESLKMILKDEFLILTAEEKEEALIILREKSVDLVILDTPVPDTDVLTLAENIRKVKDRAVIVILSTSKGNALAELKYNGVYEVVNKPFQRKELLNVMKKAHERSGLLTELEFLRSQADRVNGTFEKLNGQEYASQAPYYYQEAIRKFSKALTHIFDRTKLLDSIVSAIAEIFEVNKVSILLKDEKSSQYRVKASIGFQESVANEIKLKEGEGIAGWLRRERQILRKENLSVRELLPEYLLMTGELDALGAYLCFPLFAHGDLIAIISLGKKTIGDKFTYEDIRLLTMMADYAAVSIYNSFLYQEVSFQKNYHQIIMSNIPTGVITVDNEGRITTVNKAGRRILRLGEGEIIGESVQKTGSIIADIMLRTLKEERTYNRHEVVLPGKHVSLGISASLLKDENEKIIGGVMVFTDLSRVKGLEEKVEKLEKKALWRKFTESIAHEIRNPLVSIKTFTQLFPDKYQDEQFRKDFYRTMCGDVDKLNELIDKLEKYAGPLSLNLQPENLNSIIDEILLDFKDKLDIQKITVNRNYSHNIPHVAVDRNELGGAFSHVVDNSVRAMSGGGTLTISTRIKKEEVEEIVVEFSDTGEGISQENMKELFSPFFSTHFKGLGLGLPIAQKIVEAHEGRIEANFTLKKGTSFKIFLPVTSGMEKPGEEGIPAKSAAEEALKSLSLQKAVEIFERNLIQDALTKSDGIQTKAAESLKMSRRILKYKMDKLGIERKMSE